MKNRRVNNNNLEIYDENENIIIVLEENMKDGVFSINARGELRNEVAHDFEDEISAAFSVCPKINLNLSETTYIAGFALKAILNLQLMVDGNENAEFIISGVSSQVKDELEKTGFIDLLQVEENV